MGAVGYTYAVSERDYYQAEQARESAEIDATPEAERQEIRDIHAARGFTGDLLEQVVDTITADREAWMATMMNEELHLQPVQTPDIMRSAVVSWAPISGLVRPSRQPGDLLLLGRELAVRAGVAIADAEVGQLR